mgnify:FL=1
MKRITFTGDYITLGPFLKLADVVSTGGQAKFFLREHVVTVNGEPENRRGRKLVHLDTVEIENIGRFQAIRV